MIEATRKEKEIVKELLSHVRRSSEGAYNQQHSMKNKSATDARHKHNNLCQAGTV